MNELVHVIYCSQAADNLTPSAILRMVEQSQDKNHKAGISGMLLFGNGYFLQLIEGPRQAVNDLYHRIVRDERHRHLLLVDFEYIQQRDFAKWGMGLYDVARNRDGQIAAICGEHFNPFTYGRAQCRELLHRCADALLDS